MNYGPANFYDDGVRPIRKKNPPTVSTGSDEIQPPTIAMAYTEKMLKTRYPPAVETAEAAIFSLIPANIPLSEIMYAVCILERVGRSEFHGQLRQWRIVRARHVYFYLARQLTRNSFPQIARRCGNRDHSTAMHGYAKVRDNLAQYADTISEVKKLLGVE